jgi:hypothetical protein
MPGLQDSTGLDMGGSAMTRFYSDESGVAVSEYDINETICAERDAALARVAELQNLLRNTIQPEAYRGKADCESCHAIFHVCDDALPSPSRR